MEALRGGVEIATSAVFSKFPFAVAFASILQGFSPTDHPMVSALKALPDTVVDLRTLLMFLSSRNYVRSPMVVALSLFQAYQLTPREYGKDSYIGYVHRMAELYQRAPFQPDELPMAPEIPLLLAELESAFKFNFVMVVAAHTTSFPLPRGIWGYCEDEKMSLLAIVSELRDDLTWRQRIRARDVEPPSKVVASPPTSEPPTSSGGVRPGHGALPLSRVGPGQQRRPPYRPLFMTGRSGPPHPPVSSAPTAIKVIGATYHGIDVEMETSCNTFEDGLTKPKQSTSPVAQVSMVVPTKSEKEQVAVEDRKWPSRPNKRTRERLRKAGLVAVQGTNKVIKSVRHPVDVSSDRPSGQATWKKEPLPMLPPKSRGQAPVHREWIRPPPAQRKASPCSSAKAPFRAGPILCDPGRGSLAELSCPHPRAIFGHHLANN
jgi:hypothetical protein